MIRQLLHNVSARLEIKNDVMLKIVEEKKLRESASNGRPCVHLLLAHMHFLTGKDAPLHHSQVSAF